MRPAAVILAAGMGKRMNSSIPKVMHRVLEKPMLLYVLDAALSINPGKIVLVAGKDHDAIKEALPKSRKILLTVQRKPKGTADALLTGANALKGGKSTLLVLNGDTPLIRPQTLRKFLALHKKDGNSISMISFITRGDNSYGKVLRDEAGKVKAIVEALDAGAEERKINEVNSGIYALEPDALSHVPEIKLNRKKGEYYLTDIIDIALRKGKKIGVYCLGAEEEFLGINTRQELLEAQEIMRWRVVEDFIKKGVDFMDVNTAFIHPSVKIERETVIYPNVYIHGKTRIGRGCTIYPNVRIVDSTLGDCSVVKDSSVIEGSTVGRGAQIGPFAHLRPQSTIGEASKIGNFVEVKKSAVGKGTKAMHLSYLGDAKIGSNVNIGAGTITCNYDGLKKHRTVIEDNVFIGSDTQMIAPVRIKRDSYVAAGSTVTKDVPSMSLAISRTPQKNIKGWAKKKNVEK
jgi:bifunctional UDP-N-acetylglucosamine pyrophosphorylase/glucosamine-1-phosphate N-acetyltransferase